MTNKLVVVINSLKVPKIKKILLYEMKFLVPNYSCLQNPWLGGYRPQIPLLSVLCPQLNLLNPPPEQNSWVRHCLWLRFWVVVTAVRICIVFFWVMISYSLVGRNLKCTVSTFRPSCPITERKWNIFRKRNSGTWRHVVWNMVPTFRRKRRLHSSGQKRRPS